MINIGQRFYAIRLDKKVTQAQLVKRSGIPQARISDIEKGKRDMTVSTLLRLCHALDITPVELFSETISKRPKSHMTRRWLERMAKVVWNPSLASDDRDQVTADLLRRLAPISHVKKGQKESYAAWSQLCRRYSEGEINILMERVRDEEQRRDAKKHH